MGVEIDEKVDAFLEHYGVRGMQWGVRRTRRTQRLARAAAADSSVSSRARAVGIGGLGVVRVRGRVGPIDLVKGGGIRGGATRKVGREVAREARIKAGKAKTSDILVRVGSTRVTDIVPVRTKNTGKKTIMDNDKAIVAAAGAVFVAQYLGRRALRKAVTRR